MDNSKKDKNNGNPNDVPNRRSRWQEKKAEKAAKKERESQQHLSAQMEMTVQRLDKIEPQVHNIARVVGTDMHMAVDFLNSTVTNVKSSVGALRVDHTLLDLDQAGFKREVRDEHADLKKKCAILEEKNNDLTKKCAGLNAELETLKKECQRLGTGMLEMARAIDAMRGLQPNHPEPER